MISTSAHVMTLANSIIGVSILAMPYCFKQCGIFLSVLMLIFSNILTRLCCHFLVKSATITRRRTYEFLAYHTFGPTGKLAVELSIIGFLLGTCIAFFVVMGDLGPDIIEKATGFNKTQNLRTIVLLVLAVMVVLPLGLLRNVDSLSSVCTASILFYLCLVLKIVSEATPHLLAADWLDHVNLWRPAGILQCLPIFSMALACQTQVFEIYETIPDASASRMNEIVKAAVNICTGVYICVGFFGYVAFCTQNFTGNILMSFSPSSASDVIKLGFVLAVAVSFPLVIFPCRTSLYSLLFRRVSSRHSELVPGPVHIPEGRFKCLTIFLITVSLSVGLLLPNIELVLGLVGSTIGTIICLLLPALIFTRLASKYSSERLIAQVIFFIAAGVLVLSTYANLYAADKAVAGEIYEPPMALVSQKPIDLIHKQQQQIVDIKKPLEPEVVLGHGVIGGDEPGKKLKDIIKEVEKDKLKQKIDVIPIKDKMKDIIEKTKKKADEIKKAEEIKLIPEIQENQMKNKKEEVIQVPQIPEIKPPNLEVPEIKPDLPKSVEKPNIPVKEPIVLKPVDQVPQEAIKNEEEERKVEEEKTSGEKIESKVEAKPAEHDHKEHKELLETLAKHQETQEKLLEEQKQILHEIKEQQKQNLVDTEIKKKDDIKENEQNSKELIKEIKETINAEKDEAQPREEKIREIVSGLEKLTKELVSLDDKPKAEVPVDENNKIDIASKAQPVAALLKSRKSKENPVPAPVKVDNKIPVEKIENNNIEHPREKRDTKEVINDNTLCTNTNKPQEDLIENEINSSNILNIKPSNHLTVPEIKLKNDDLSIGEIKLENSDLNIANTINAGKPMSRDLKTIKSDDEN